MKTRLLALKTISLIPISFQLMGTKNTWWVQLRHYSARWQPCCRMCRSDQENLYLYPISQGVTTCDPNLMKPTSDTVTASVQVVSHTLLCTWRLGAFCFQHQPIKSSMAMMFIIIIIANAFVFWFKPVCSSVMAELGNVQTIDHLSKIALFGIMLLVMVV